MFEYTFIFFFINITRRRLNFYEVGINNQILIKNFNFKMN